MKWIIDRFEEDFAVIECNGRTFDVPKNMLPTDLAEGDVLDISLNKAETEQKRESANSRLKKLFGE